MKQYTNPINTMSIQFEESQLLTFHNDGRVTTGSKLKPDKTAARVLDHIKNQWFKDAQATKIRELQEQNDLLEDWKQSALAVEREWNANAIATMLGGKLGESQREVIQREVPKLLDRIKELEAVVNDPEVLWTNWLRGTVKLPVGIGDVRQYQEHIKRLEREIQELKIRNEYAWQKNGKLNERIQSLIKLGLKTTRPDGLEQWQEEEEL